MPTDYSQVKSGDFANFILLISDNNPAFDNLQPYVDWIAKMNPWRILMIPTGRWQLHSMHLRARALDPEAGITSLPRHSRELEKKTTTRAIKDSLKLREKQCYATIKIKIADDDTITPGRGSPDISQYLERHKKAVLKKSQQLQALLDSHKIPYKTEEFPAEIKGAVRVDEELRALLSDKKQQDLLGDVKGAQTNFLHLSTEAIPSQILALPEFDLVDFLISPYQYCARLSELPLETPCCMFMSAGSFANSKGRMEQYEGMCERFQKFISEKTNEKIFQNLVYDIAQERLSDQFNREKANIKLTELDFINTNLALGIQQVTLFLMDEVPALMLLVRLAIELFADQRKTTALCYPTSYAINGERIFNYVFQLCSSLGMQYKHAISVIDITKLRLEAREDAHVQAAMESKVELPDISAIPHAHTSLFATSPVSAAPLPPPDCHSPQLTKSSSAES